MRNVPRLYQPWCPLLAPPVLVLDFIRVVQFVSLRLVAKNDNVNTPPAQNARDDGTNTIGSAGTKVDRMRSSLWEVDGLDPVKRERKNLFCYGPRDRRSGAPEIRSWEEKKQR